MERRSKIVLDPRVLVAGGAVALIGVVVMALFMWMVPNAAAREAKAACAGLKPNEPNPALCRNGGECKFPMLAPDFTAYDNNGKPVHLSDFRGKVVLLNFWASWCGVCRDEKPHLNEMAKDLVGDDFVVIALASDRSWTDVLVAIVDALRRDVQKPTGNVTFQQALDAYQKALPNGVPFKVFLDPPSGDSNIGAIASSWGITAVPESALIDRNGNIRAYFANRRDWQSPVAETCIRSVIDGD